MKFVDLILRNTPLKDCHVVYKGDSDLYRLYADIDRESNIFYAQALEIKTYDNDEDGECEWDYKSLEVNVLFNAHACFDGVRHLHFSVGNEGYINYPNMKELLIMLQKVREIELEVCWDCIK